MRILLAVAEDFYIFISSVLFSRRTNEPRIQTPMLAPPVEQTVLPTPPKTSKTKPDARRVSTARPTLGRHTIAYIKKDRASLRMAPEAGSDDTLATLAYGEMVMVLATVDDWVQVAAGDRSGYVHHTDLAPDAGSVFPQFVVGEENGPQDSNTLRLRRVIADEFSGRAAQLSLEAHEYVYYKLVKRGITIDWPDIRPRTPGTWVRILSPLPEVAVSAEPSEGAVVELFSPEGGAHLAYVESVDEDGTIVISEANYPHRGIYNERTLTQEEWRQHNASFLRFG